MGSADDAQRVEGETSITEAIEGLRAAGYDGDFSVDGTMVRCGPCGHRHEPADVVIREIVRIEGSTDPADESIVMGLTCSQCGKHGVLVAAYGPAADADEAAVLTALVDGRR
jgi:hypothetical protein